jgi:hypothetical protein
MAFPRTFTAVRANAPHWPSVLNTLRQTDPAVGGSVALGDPMSVTLDKDTDWTPQQVSGTQNAINSAPADTQQLRAQFDVDSWPVVTKALVLALIDQLNTIRAALPTPLPAITPAQAIAAIRTKAGTL